MSATDKAPAQTRANVTFSTRKLGSPSKPKTAREKARGAGCHRVPDQGVARAGGLGHRSLEEEERRRLQRREQERLPDRVGCEPTHSKRGQTGGERVESLSPRSQSLSTSRS